MNLANCVLSICRCTDLLTTCTMACSLMMVLIDRCIPEQIDHIDATKLLALWKIMKRSALHSRPVMLTYLIVIPIFTYCLWNRYIFLTKNLFGLLRLLCISFVIYCHCFLMSFYLLPVPMGLIPMQGNRTHQNFLLNESC